MCTKKEKSRIINVSPCLKLILVDSQQCYRRDRTSYRLADLVTADRKSVSSLESCASLCANRASCNSLSFK